MDGVDGQTPRLGAGLGKNLGVELHGKVMTGMEFAVCRKQTYKRAGLTVSPAQ
jgi:hypothetical protein